MSLSPDVGHALADSGKSIAITGAGGWLGLATLEYLRGALGEALSQRVHCFGSSHRQLRLMDGSTVPQRPLTDLATLSAPVDFVLHLAFLTKDRAVDMAEDDYVAANRQLSQIVAAALDRLGTSGVFVASSGAAAVANDPARSREMRLYGSLKRNDEDLFADWARIQGATALIGRIYNLSGPHMNKLGNYALGSFIRDSLAGKPIRVLGPHPVVRGYVAIRDVMSFVFARLLAGETGDERFDTGGKAMELGEVATAVDAVLSGAGVDRAAMTSDVADVYLGDDQRWRQLLADNGIAPTAFPDQVAETAQYLERHLSEANRV